MLPEPIAVTLQVIDALEQVDAPYVIGGSLASTIHGVVRTTLDTDIVADLSLSQAEPFADLLAPSIWMPAGHHLPRSLGCEPRRRGLARAGVS